jgi:hypothetical protein
VAHAGRAEHVRTDGDRTVCQRGAGTHCGADPPSIAAKRPEDWASAAASPPDRPSPPLRAAAPLPTGCPPPPDRTPDSPPASFHDWRSAAPDAVPGSTNASSRNSTSGQTAPIAIMTAPTIAIPAAWAVESPFPATTPAESWTPIPRTSEAIGEMSRQEMNQRRLFQNQLLVLSLSSPPAEIGAVAARMMSAASRTNMITR